MNKPEQMIMKQPRPAAERQVGGTHYKRPIQHWDIVALFDLDYFQGYATKYIFRWRKKGGIEDLEKAVHVLQKYIEIERARVALTFEDDMYDRIIQEIERIDQDKQRILSMRAEALGDRPSPLTPEQEARDMLERMEVCGRDPQTMSSGELVELANLIATVRACQRATPPAP